MTPRDGELVASLCAERAGLKVDPEKAYMLENRLGPVARRESFGSVEDLVAAIRDRGEERLIWAMVEAMSPAETGFFREPGALELIVDKVLPELARSRDGAPLRVWSAACGTGQEAYSLAMLLAEQPPKGVTVELFASDLCDRRLEKAQAGTYSQFEVQRGLSAHRLVRHFEAAEDGYALTPKVRQLVRWSRVNLLDDVSRLGRFDVILCRNILGAFEEDARRKVMDNLAARLTPGGALVLGAAEAAADLSAAPGRPGFHVNAPRATRAAA